MDAAGKRDGVAKHSRLVSHTDRRAEPVKAKKGLSATERAQRKRAQRAAVSDAGMESLLDDLMKPAGTSDA